MESSISQGTVRVRTHRRWRGEGVVVWLLAAPLLLFLLIPLSAILLRLDWSAL
ncbi:hypothetical protein HC891_14000 [Candidatus Gracilibacteria bacterium]|nr:hypothetical protein [Candidatus Gracilibacteria bacterium]